MTDVVFGSVTAERNENCIALYKRDGEISDADTFQFGDEYAFNQANGICEVLADAEVTYTVFDGKIGGAICLVLVDDESNDAKIFEFGNARDLATACEMANRFIELDGEDDETADSDE